MAQSHESAHHHDRKRDEVAARDHFPRVAEEELQAGPLVRVAATENNRTHQQREGSVPACLRLQVGNGHALQRSKGPADRKADSSVAVLGVCALSFTRRTPVSQR